VPGLPGKEGGAPPFGPGVLAAQLTGSIWEGSAGDYWQDVFPPPAWQENWFEERAFELLYTGHGGSGLNLTLHDIEEMDVAKITWWRERLNAQREADVKAIKEAQAAK
jgi:hypothetical protein